MPRDVKSTIDRYFRAEARLHLDEEQKQAEFDGEPMCDHICNADNEPKQYICYGMPYCRLTMEGAFGGGN